MVNHSSEYVTTQFVLKLKQISVAGCVEVSVKKIKKLGFYWFLFSYALFSSLASADDQTYLFDISQQSADGALTVLADQADITVVFDYDAVSKFQANQLRGEYLIREAVDLLLAGTSLNSEFSDSGHLIITHKNSSNETNNMKTSRRNSLFTALFGASLATSVGHVNAQDSAGFVLEEIMVTSRRYEESIQDAPLAVNVLDGAYLEAQGVDDFSGALELTPGATWGHYTMAQPGHTLRGMESYNSGNATLESSVQVVVDGVALTKAFMMTPPIYDVQRVEIMRGPQGTTFGRNASLGIAHFVTGRPDQEYSASLNATVGTRGHVGFGGHVNGGVTDDLSVRIAFNKKAADGNLEDAETGAPLEGDDTWGLRGSVLYEPSDDFSAYFKGEHIVDRGKASARRHGDCENPNINQNATRFVDTGTGDTLVIDYTPSCDPWKATISPEPAEGYFQNRDMTHLTAELSWVVGDLNVTSVTGYQWGEHEVINDIFSSPVVIQDQNVRNDANVWSTELRIDNHGSDDAVRWLLGVYLLEDEEYRMENNTAVPDRVGDVLTVNRAQSSITAHGWSETSSQAIFGELAFDLGERTELAIGGRYTNEKKSYDFTNECYGRAGGCNFPTALGSLDPGYEEFYDAATDCNANIVDGLCGDASNPMGIGIGDPLHISKTWDDFSAKVSLSHEINANHSVYALYSEAFKSGGFHHDARSVGQFYESVLDPEYVSNFEIGLKGSYDTVRYAITAFMQEQEDAQSSSLVADGAGGYLTVLNNLGGIEQKGIEFEGTWLVTENLLIGGNFALYDGELAEGSAVGFDTDDVTGDILFTDVSGSETGMKETWVLYVEHTINLNSGGTITTRVDNQHRGKIPPPAQFADYLALDGETLAYERPEINNLGASIAWKSADEGTTVRVWGENMLEEVDFGGFGPNSGYYFNGAQPIRNHWGRNRFGLDVKLNF